MNREAIKHDISNIVIHNCVVLKTSPQSYAIYNEDMFWVLVDELTDYLMASNDD